MDEDARTFLEIYRVAVDMADRTSARRAGSNTFFLTLNTALAATVGIVSAARKPPPHGNLPAYDAYGLVLTAAAGIVISLTWRALLHYYRRLNKAKFAVITLMEERLPARPFTEEWANLCLPPEIGQSRGPLRWRRRHHEATIVEQVVPLVFVAIYLALAIRVLAL